MAESYLKDEDINMNNVNPDAVQFFEDYSTFVDAINVIKDAGREWEAITLLLDWIKTDKETADSQNAEMSACLRAIKKINRGKNRAIDALCEREDGEQK